MLWTAFLATALFFIYGGIASGGGQARAEIVAPTGQIPRDSYKTWSLFLVCNPNWVTPDKSSDLANLYRRFRAFGAAIGSDNLAVWFWTRQTTIDDPRLADSVDVARGADYCKELKLRPTSGPFLVVTSAYPELRGFPRDRAVFELGDLQPADLATLLDDLTDQLLLEGKVDAARVGAAPAPPLPSTPTAAGSSTSLWIRLLEGAQRSMIGFGCRLRMRIDTGVLTAELRECAGP